jgi:hypothetical protein
LFFVVLAIIFLTVFHFLFFQISFFNFHSPCFREMTEKNEIFVQSIFSFSICIQIFEYNKLEVKYQIFAEIIGIQVLLYSVETN